MKTKLPFFFVFLFTLFTSQSIMAIEVPISGLAGYYDLQSHGRSMRQLYFFNSSIIHAIYMTSLDSNDIDANRRTRYSLSSDGGKSWNYVTTVPTNPNLRTGFGFLTSSSGTFEGNAVIANH